MIADGLLERVKKRVRAIVVGNGLDDGVTMGPLASAAQREKYRAYMSAAHAEGHVLETPAQRAEPEGGYFATPASACRAFRSQQESGFRSALVVAFSSV